MLYPSPFKKRGWGWVHIMYMRNNTQWSFHPVVFFNLLMLVVTKRHTYLNKPGSLNVEFFLKYIQPFVVTRR